MGIKMIKNNMKKTTLALALLGTSLMADNAYAFNGYSLVGVETGYSNISAEMTDLEEVLPHESLDGSLYNIGLKIGAQTGHYRIFLNANMHQDTGSDFDYITTYGVEGQYLFTMLPQTDFFIGIGAGVANMKFQVDGEPFSRTINDPYMLGSLGVNLHATDNIDVEVGVKYTEIDASNTKEVEDSIKEYRFDSMISAYASVIFKYQMD
jgi:opacity protein-like surface antigen